MKVLVVNTNQTDKNGVTNVIFNYLMVIGGKGLRMDVVSINKPDGQYVEMVQKAGGVLFVIERSFRKILSYWFRLICLIKREKYDIVHIHGNSHTVVLELTAAWLAGAKVRIVHSHNTKCEHNVVHKVFYPLFNLLVTNRLACGNEAGVWMYGDKSFDVVKNGVDTSIFAYNKFSRDKIRTLNGWSEDCIVVGHVGYFYEVKNHRHIVNVFEQLYKNNDKYRLVLIGDGILRDEIQDIIHQKNLDDECLLTGNIDNVDEYVNAMDVVIMPSLFEGLPLTLIEQQANGLGCIVSDNITPEVNITGNVRFLSLNDSLQTWCGSVASVVDKDERATNSISSIQLIKTAGYDVISEAEKLKDFYFSLVQ